MAFLSLVGCNLESAMIKQFNLTSYDKRYVKDNFNTFPQPVYDLKHSTRTTLAVRSRSKINFVKKAC